MVLVRARSVLAETEEPTVLTQILRTETEIEPTCISSTEWKRNRNRTSEPRVTEMAVFLKKWAILPYFNISFPKRKFKLIEKRVKLRNRLKKIISIVIYFECSIWELVNLPKIWLLLGQNCRIFRTVRTVEPILLEPELEIRPLLKLIETGTECFLKYRTRTGKIWNWPSTRIHGCEIQDIRTT